MILRADAFSGTDFAVEAVGVVGAEEDAGEGVEGFGMISDSCVAEGTGRS